MCRRNFKNSEQNDSKLTIAQRGKGTSHYILNTPCSICSILHWNLIFPGSKHCIPNLSISFYGSLKLKVAYFQRVRLIFQISKEKIFQKTILNLKSKIPAHNSIILWAGILNFRFRIVIWNIFLEIWRFEKRIVLSEKKPPSDKHSLFYHT